MKKVTLNSFLCILVSLLVSCNVNNNVTTSNINFNPSTNPTSEKDNESIIKKWDISLRGEGSVLAELESKNNQYRLIISGTGKMKTFSSENNVPFKDYLPLLNEIEILEGVTNLSSYVLSNINLEYIYLPNSITEVEDFATNGSVFLLTCNNEISYSLNVDNVYHYVERDMTTTDIYWQQGKSTGDIISDNYKFNPIKKYWYIDKNNNPITKTKIKILFIGNSFTHRNGIALVSSGVPGIFDDLVESLGYKCETYAVTGSSWYLDKHADKTDECGKQVDKLLNACSDFDYVVLQEQSTVPLDKYNRFLSGVKALKNKIDATQDNAKVVLYQTWSSPYAASERKTTIWKMEQQLRDAYDKVATECNIDSISPVGKAFAKSYYENSDIYLWGDDDRHQGYAGAYLSACVHASNILNIDIRNSTFEISAQYREYSLEKSTYEYLKEVAYKVVIQKVEVNINK